MNKKLEVFKVLLKVLFAITIIVGLDLYVFDKPNIENEAVIEDAVAQIRVDDRLDINDKKIEENLKLNLLSYKSISSQDYFFKKKHFPSGGRAKNTLITLYTEGGYAISSYVDKVRILRGEKEIPADYSAYPMGENDMILILGMEGEVQNGNLFVEFEMQSVDSDQKLKIKKEIPTTIKSIEGVKDNLLYGELAKIADQNYHMILTKRMIPERSSRGYKANVRILTIGSESKIDIGKVLLVNIHSGQSLSKKEYQVSIYYPTSKGMAVYSGETNKMPEKNLTIEFLTNDKNRVNDIVNNYVIQILK